MDAHFPKPLMQEASRDSYSPVVAKRVERFTKKCRRALLLLRYRLTCYLLDHLWFLQHVSDFLRRRRPVFVLGKLVVVTRAREAREVLERFDDFTLGDIIDPGMPWGTFLMTVDWRKQHAQERRWLEDAVRLPDDIEKVRAIVDARCQQIQPAGRRLNVVTELLEPVVVDIARDYFGVPPLAGNPQRMALAMRDLAGIIMVNPPVGSAPWTRSRASIAGVTDLVLTELSHAGACSCADNLLTRLVQRLPLPDKPDWFDEDWIRRYLTGLIATGGATIVRAGAGAIDRILEHPTALQEAQSVARDLDQAIKRREQQRVDELRTRLRHFLYEALRFRPMLPLLFRDAPRATVIAYGTKDARIVPAGAKVFAPPLAAMFDPEAVPDPERFDASRPFDQYLHFGFGPRHCFGRYIAETALLEVFRSLLLRPGLSRAPGRDGRLTFDGPAAAGLVVTF